MAISGALPYRALWLSFLELERMNLRTEASCAAEMDAVCQGCRSLGLTHILAQVRPFGDALYRSGVYPFSHLLTGRQGQDPGYDPLAVLLARAKAHGLAVEAWINPYRILSPHRPVGLAPTHPALHWMQADGDSRRRVLRWADGLYLNPASDDAISLIAGGAAEIVQGYPVKGIHIDDYFYPTADPALDAESWRGESTCEGLPKWRRANTSRMVRALYESIKQARPDATLTISPLGSLEQNLSEQFSDVPRWLGEGGFCDAVIPQLYWGRHIGEAPGTPVAPVHGFELSLETWRAMPRHASVRLMVGLGAYRIGCGDEEAADQAEWHSGHALADQVRVLQAAGDVDGFAIFRYASLFGPDGDAALKAAERDSLRGAIQQCKKGGVPK